MKRRTFLKIASMGSVALTAGCTARPEDHLFAMARSAEDMVAGEPTWYASTCRECPAGCGLLAKNREGRVIKLEGNPLHPVNRGALCARGHAALQGVYNPDRLSTPLLKSKNGWREISFPKAEEMIRSKAESAAKGGSGRIAMITETVGRTQLELFTAVMEHFGGQSPIIFEPFAHEALKFAFAELFAIPMLPVLRMDRADVMLGFGADFLETWLSPVEYARKFKQMHALEEDRKGVFVQVSPFQNLTGANADRWIGCRPESEVVVILGLIRIVLGDEKGRRMDDDLRSALRALTADHTPERVAQTSDVKPEDLAAVGERLLAAHRPLVLGVGTCGGRHAAAAELAALFLNLALDPELSLFDFDRRHRVEIAHRRARVLETFDAMADGAFDLVFLNQVNPVFTLPGGGRIAKMLSEKECFVVAFSNFMDETAQSADLIVPVQLPLETWDAYESDGASLSTLQPAMGTLTRAPALGDLLLDLLPTGKRPAQSYPQLVTETVLSGAQRATPSRWLETVQRGGRFIEEKKDRIPPRFDLKAAETLGRLLSVIPEPAMERRHLLVFPSNRFLDGRGANRPWLLEIPDTISQIAWASPALIHPSTMAAAGLKDGDAVTLDTPAARIEAFAYAYAGVFPGTVAASAGLGHTALGRWGSGQGVNFFNALDPSVDVDSGAPAFVTQLTGIGKTGRSVPLPITSGSRFSFDRKIALSVRLDETPHAPDHGEPGLTMERFPLTLPLAEGYDPARDIYPPHPHEGYRWAMVVDMDRCIGCSACVAGCYAENNIGVVGEKRIAEGREMAWLQIQRYHDPADMARMTFIPMMCQHCDNAPCEAVCPVYAPHHSQEGLNNQIYNRCIGTRFCGQNCPYKVRRFNWFDWKWPRPLDMQLNPNVTVRGKGVMEKCSFCIQRIKEARNQAKNENRSIRDGEVTPACAQTCPTGALSFGNLMDPRSRVRRMADSPRAYQVMGYLNTKPAVIYLKKVLQTV